MLQQYANTCMLRKKKIFMLDKLFIMHCFIIILYNNITIYTVLTGTCMYSYKVLST